MRSGTGRAAGALANTTLRSQVESSEELVERADLQPGEVALAWLLSRPGVTGPIVGPRTSSQLDSALRAVMLRLNEELLRLLDDVFPGPGASPEAFA